MIKLTLLLLAAIGVTMVVAGRDPVDVARADAGPPPGTVPAPVEGAAEPSNRLALDDEAGAIQRALAASSRPKPAAEPEVHTASPGISGASAEDAWYVTGTRVNLRAGPSTSSAVVGQVTDGQRAEILDRTDDGWVEIRVIQSGLTAYVFGRFVAERPAG